MANEITVGESLVIRDSVGTGFFQAQPSGFKADLVNPYFGPTPGSVHVTHAGVDVDLSKLTYLGGHCRINNNDAAATVQVGVRDTVSNVFYPLVEVPPGEFCRFRLSSHLLTDEAGTGSPGAAYGGSAVLHAKTDGGTAAVDFLAFDK